MAETPTLKPCPFCGGPARSGFTEPMRGCHNGEAWVECEVCEVVMYAPSTSNGTVDDAIAAWNRRALEES